MSSDSSGEELSCTITWRLNTISGKQSKSKTAITSCESVKGFELFGIKWRQNKTIITSKQKDGILPLKAFFSIFQELLPPAVPPPQDSTLWAVKPAEKAKYDNIFEVSQLSWKLGSLLCFWETDHPFSKPLKLVKTVKSTMPRFCQDFSFDYGNTIGFYPQIILLLLGFELKGLII